MKTSKRMAGAVGLFLTTASLLIHGQTASTPAQPATPTTSGGTAAAKTPPPTAATTTSTAPIATPGTTSTPATTEQMQPIFVTGSAIPTTDTEGANPVTVIDSQAIQQRGYSSAEDIIKNLPGNGSFASPGQTSNAFAAGGAYASLRGLGPQATLVLINGRRVSNYAAAANGQYAFVDLNNIPAQIIDRVEVLTEGTSLYGSDAVAGVINIITKTDLGADNGVVDAYVGNTTSHDALVQRYTMMGSLDSFDKNGYGLVEADYAHQNPMFGNDLKISQTADQSINGGFNLDSARVFPGEFFGETSGNIFTLNPGRAVGNVPLTGTTNATDPNVEDDPTFAIPNLYNYNPDTSVIPETQRYGVYMNYSYKFYDGNITPHIDFDYRHNSTHLSAAPAGTVIGDDNPPESSGPLGAPGPPQPIFIVPTTNPYNQTGEAIDILSYRFVPLGPRIEDVENDVFRAVPSIDFKLGDGWTLNAALNYSYNFIDDTNNNFPSDTGFQNALNRTGLDAYNPFTTVSAETPAQLAGIFANTETRSSDSILAEDFRLNGKLFDLPAGPVQLAFGGEYRVERFNEDYTEDDENGNVISSSVQLPTAASQKDLSGFAEVDFPLTSPSFNIPGFYSVDLIASGRVDKYTDFGSTENPNIRLRWEVVPGLIVRGGYSKAFRAPSLVELANGGGQAFEFVFDPVTGTQPEVLVNTPGNSKLQPETAECFSGGVAYSPEAIKGLLFTADYFKIRYSNQILEEDPQTLIDEGSPLVVRNPTTGNIQSITATFENLDSSYINGVDFGASYVWGDPNSDIGQFDFNYNATLLIHYRTNDGDSTTENVGIDSGGLGPYSRYKQDVSATWNYHGFSYTLANNLSSSYQDSTAEADGLGYNRNVATWITFDMQASYEFDKEEFEKMVAGPTGPGFDWRSLVEGTRIAVGCDNVWDFTPPFTANPSDTLGFDPAYADPTGRFLYAEITKKF